eukprot:GFYU01030117.1.p2 GENE.GFYU01030117.1~~GFYU01030117.1.p2  ORF type:complete len:168 (-),score=31.00 GFYU01030117.1:225-728(-)
MMAVVDMLDDYFDDWSAAHRRRVIDTHWNRGKQNDKRVAESPVTKETFASVLAILEQRTLDKKEIAAVLHRNPWIWRRPDKLTATMGLLDEMTDYANRVLLKNSDIVSTDLTALSEGWRTLVEITDDRIARNVLSRGGYRLVAFGDFTEVFGAFKAAHDGLFGDMGM